MNTDLKFDLPKARSESPKVGIPSPTYRGRGRGRERRRGRIEPNHGWTRRDTKSKFDLPQAASEWTAPPLQSGLPAGPKFGVPWQHV